MLFRAAFTVLLLAFALNTASAQTGPAVVNPAVPVATPTATPAQAQPQSFADLADRLLPSVVNISTTQIIGKNNQGDENANPFPDMPMFPPGSPFEDFFKDFFERGRPLGPNGAPAPRRATSLGSGFIIDASGLIVTNNHVIDGADEITVTLHDNTELQAELVGRDSKTDLALLRVKSKQALPAIVWGESDAMRVGDWVLAIGNPFGLGGTVTQGIISARARDINAGPYDDFIQTDASINRGNSGGPMFNLKGEVIGINTAIFSPSGGSVGIGFAIPSNLAKNVLAQLQTNGKITRGWIGVRIQQVNDDIAKSLNMPKTMGALVSSVTAKSPAADTGLKSGDVITHFNGREIAEMRRLPRLVAETKIGSKVPLQVWRDGKAITLNIKIAELPADLADADQAGEEAPADSANPQRSETIDALGLKVATLTPALRQRFELEEQAKGLVILEVDATSDAAEKGLQAGDLIVEAGQKAVVDAAGLNTLANNALKAGKPVLLLVERAGDARFVALATQAKSSTKPKAE